jgi:hypothetical protein
MSDDLPSNFLAPTPNSRRQIRPAPIQAVGYTRQNSFTSGIRLPYTVADGKPLHDDGFFGEAKQVFEKVKRRTSTW